MAPFKTPRDPYGLPVVGDFAVTKIAGAAFSVGFLQNDGETPGTRLGPYEVTAQIGVGGIGEVCKATDTNLKRAIAIKVLPASVAADTERLARKHQEQCRFPHFLEVLHATRD